MKILITIVPLFLFFASISSGGEITILSGPSGIEDKKTASLGAVQFDKAHDGNYGVTLYGKDRDGQMAFVGVIKFQDNRGAAIEYFKLAQEVMKESGGLLTLSKTGPVHTYGSSLTITYGEAGSAISALVQN